jgi:hypothetical protein
MTRVLTMAVLAVFLAPLTARSNPLPDMGYIGLYPDAGASSLCVYDTQPGELRFYVVHDMMGPFFQVQYLYFSAPKPTCFLATHVMDMNGPGGIITAGNSQTGVEIFLIPPCLSSPGAGHVMTIVYSVSGGTPNDCYYPILPDAQGRLEAATCGGFEGGFLAPRSGLINPSHPGLCVVTTEETTWGRVKALYQ